MISSVLPGYRYLHKRDHHNGNPTKSQWVISCPDEEASFRQSISNGWISGDAWGLHVVGNRAGYLGVGVERSRRLFIAKFTNGSAVGLWHGYPADPVAYTQDKPPSLILRGWGAARLLRAATVRKVARGQPCKL